MTVNSFAALCESWEERARASIERVQTVLSTGKVMNVLDSIIETSLQVAKVGELCEIFDPRIADAGGPDSRFGRILGEVVGFNQTAALIAPFGTLEGLSSQHVVRCLKQKHEVVVGEALLGRVLDGFGQPLDRRAPLSIGDPSVVTMPVIAAAPAPTERPRIDTTFGVGVRVIDSLFTLGEGQRIGILAGPGCGKTSLMAAIARGSDADAIVFGLIGERGREVREFTEHELPPEVVAKSVFVCATSDRPAIERTRAAFTATTIAEGLRNRGFKVLLVVDSLTRLARAQREIGLAAGEPPARAGFPPSVYALLPRLIERAGKTERGSITAIYTVLTEGDWRSDPISEEAVSLLDGHIMLSRKLANQGHYPAVDVLSSISRTMSNVVGSEHIRAAAKFRDLLSRFGELEMLIRLGEYKPGNDPDSDRAVEMNPQLNEFLRQDTRTPIRASESIEELFALMTH